MVQQLPGIIIVVVVAAFIFMVNSINLQKNRAIHLRAIMLHKKGEFEKGSEEFSADDVEKAVGEYNSAATIFNLSITTGAGVYLNKLLRYPEFELQDWKE